MRQSILVQLRDKRPGTKDRGDTRLGLLVRLGQQVGLAAVRRDLEVGRFLLCRERLHLFQDGLCGLSIEALESLLFELRERATDLGEVLDLRVVNIVKRQEEE